MPNPGIAPDKVIITFEGRVKIHDQQCQRDKVRPMNDAMIAIKNDSATN